PRCRTRPSGCFGCEQRPPRQERPRGHDHARPPAVAQRARSRADGRAHPDDLGAVVRRHSGDRARRGREGLLRRGGHRMDAQGARPRPRRQRGRRRRRPQPVRDARRLPPRRHRAGARRRARRRLGPRGVRRHRHRGHGRDLRVHRDPPRPDPRNDLAVRAARDRPRPRPCPLHQRRAVRRRPRARDRARAPRVPARAARARRRRQHPRVPVVRPGRRRGVEAARARRDPVAGAARPRRAARRDARRQRGPGGTRRLPGQATAGMVAGISQLLIANRGEIAVRVIRACRELGIDAHTVYEAPDRGALHVELADGATAITSYLSIPEIVAAGIAAGADAVHPGYGYLAENADFADAVEAAGMRWVGPPGSAMRALGDKIAARRLAEEAGVAVAPGYAGDDLSDAALAREARALGAPLLVKAAAGGGGRGMRAVDDVADVRAAIDSARREAAAAFGDDRVYLERRLTGARHVEVQVLADAHGSCIHLGERDCSLQRRHQKIVEESPSPAVDSDQRAALGAAAVAIASAAGYVGAGTVEFLVADDGTWCFLELNARLQVEHPVTEAVAGLDLVRAQLEVAAGEPLELEQSDVDLRGHALECRLYAEDPAAGFVPATGRLARLRLPVWPG